MKLLKKSIVNTSNPILVFDIEVSGDDHNFCLSNGVVVHNSKDISDAVVGSIGNLYNHLDKAGQLSRKYRIESHIDEINKRVDPLKDRYNDMLRRMAGE